MKHALMLLSTLLCCGCSLFQPAPEVRFVCNVPAALLVETAPPVFAGKTYRDLVEDDLAIRSGWTACEVDRTKIRQAVTPPPK